LFCITKDFCVPRKIVLYHERLLCIQLNIELCFAVVGHRSFGQSERKSGAVIVKNIKEMTYQLVRNISMILSCHAFANSRLHQPGQRWQHVDWRINLEKRLSM